MKQVELKTSKMTADEYQQTYYCNCPKCGELPHYKGNEKGQWAICKPCKIRWLLGRDVLENCEEDSEGELSGLTKVLVA